jgi:dTDP-4-amino-4,6-dideoxygalactose transaminase
MRKQFLAFGRPDFSEQEIEAVTRVLKSGWIGMGPETVAFEHELESYCNAKNVVTVNSCTSALHLSLLVHGIKPGDEVICPSFTWCSTANAAEYLGAKVIFCDINPDTYCIDSNTVMEKVSEKTKAVIPVHMAGLTAEIDKIRAELPESCTIIEDAAHALGACYNSGKPVGSSGNLTCFSFYANKNLSTAEGGAIALSDPKIAERLRSLRLHGLSSDAWDRFTTLKKFTPEMLELGYKMNYTDLQAAIGRVQLARQGEFQKRRLEIAEYYISRLKKNNLAIHTQKDILHPHHSRHLFLVEIPLENIDKARDEIISGMRKENIGASIHYKPVHQMPYYAKKVHQSLPVTERIAERIMTLPISAHMTVNDAHDVIDSFEHIIIG